MRFLNTILNIDTITIMRINIKLSVLNNNNDYDRFGRIEIES